METVVEDNFFSVALDIGASHWRLIGCSVAVAAIALALLVRRRRRKLSRLCIDSGEFGTVSVAQTAICEVAVAICSCSVPDGRAKISIRSHGGRLHLRIKLRIPMGRNICALAKKIQSAVASCLKTQFGIDNFYAIDVIVGGIKGPYASCSDECEVEEQASATQCSCSAANCCGKSSANADAHHCDGDY
ncbi:MAG: hypothetical protein LBI39_00100 [Puniceicoccales bacterium]|jgi:uncharacterized alkaline shock family protein YloU|nr:hypothetical protein [Puniceicoccales bacterium]